MVLQRCGFACGYLEDHDVRNFRGPRVCGTILTNGTTGILKFWIIITLMALLSRNPFSTLTNIVRYDNYVVSFL